jgi:hypothetical protein
MPMAEIQALVDLEMNEVGITSEQPGAAEGPRAGGSPAPLGPRVESHLPLGVPSGP